MATEAKRLWNRWPLQRPPGVDEVGIAPMSFPDRPAQTIGRFRRHQVDMVGHEAIAPHGDPGGGEFLRRDLEVGVIVRRPEERLLSPVAALGDVVRRVGHDHTRHPGHERLLMRGGNDVLILFAPSSVSLPRKGV